MVRDIKGNSFGTIQLQNLELTKKCEPFYGEQQCSTGITTAKGNWLIDQS